MKRLIGIVVLIVGTTACGSHGTDLTGPSTSIPNVAGNYSGTTTLTLPERGQTVTCATSTSVTQSGSTVNVAPLNLGASCSNMSIPIGQVSIDATGAILGSQSGTVPDPSCGVYAYTGSGGFFGRDLRYSLNATSRTCWNLNMTFQLTRR